MEAEGIDAVVITTPENVLYLTGVQIGGFWSPHALVLGRNGLHRLILREVESHWYANWAPQTWCDEWAFYNDSSPAADLIRDAVRAVSRNGVRRLGLEVARASLPHRTAEVIEGGVSPDEVVDSSYLVESLRVVKTDDEVVHLREAGRISRLGHEAAAHVLREGGSDAEAVAAGLSEMYAAGSEFVALGPLVAIGPESAMAHPPWRRGPVHPGELATVETSASIHRYQGPIERTYLKTSGLSDESSTATLRRLIDLAVACVTTVVSSLKPGMTSHEADSVARAFFRDAGVGDSFINRLGYSIGLAFPPVWWENDIMQLRPEDSRELRPGMVFHLVPALHVQGAGIITLSRAVLITEDCCELLNDMPLDLDPL
jgi:Xaa-Pro dipeptidase